MALRSNRVLKKYAPFYERVRVTEGSSDSEGSSMRSPTGQQACSTASFTWLHRACSMNGSFSGAPAAAVQHVPLSESPKRELRMMRCATSKAGRQSKKQKKQFPKLWW